MTAAEPPFEERFAAWLATLGLAGDGRRFVRANVREILVSKVEEGLAARLYRTLDLLGDTLVPATAARYRALAAASPVAARVALWHEAVAGVVDEAVADAGLPESASAEMGVGVESVAALLDAVLWTMPAAGDDYAPAPGERAAYDDVLARMNAENSLFTRYYGEFEGKPVVNHCPGVIIARLLVSSAWELCTETNPAGAQIA